MEKHGKDTEIAKKDVAL